MQREYRMLHLSQLHRYLGQIIGVACFSMLLARGPIICRADFIISTFGVPISDNGSWAYSKSVGVGHGNDISYQPLIADWSGADFQGYVHQGSGEFPGIGGYWHTVGAGTHDEDTIYVFTTYMMSQSDVIIPIHFDGDDGHSVYIDGVLVGGGGFAVQVDFDLHLSANVPVHIEIGDYNGPGAMAVQFFKQGSSVSLDREPGLLINADGNFTAVPLPSAIALLLTCMPVGLGLMHLRLRQTKPAA